MEEMFQPFWVKVMAGMLLCVFGSGATAAVALFGWCLAKTAKNVNDINVFHSQRRDLEHRVARIENYLNGRIKSGKETSISQQDVLGEFDSGISSSDPRCL